MKKDFKPVSKFETLLMTKEELIEYYRDLREYVYLKNEKIKGIKVRKAIYPIIKKCLKVQRKLNGRDLKILGNKATIPEERPIIYSISHIGRFDLESVCEILPTNAYMFCGDPETMYRNLDGLAANLNGVIYVDTDSKTDRHVAKEMAVRLLNQGGDLLIYPEGTWNLEECRPILHLYPGVIEMAYRTNATIIPISLEQYGNDFVANIGENFEVSQYIPTGSYNKENEAQAKSALRDVMASLKWEIWENANTTQRNEISSANYEEIVDKRLSEFPVYTREVLKHRTYREKNETPPEEVYQFVKKLNPSKENAFLLRKK